jgi:phage terminase large subunit-like protein
MKKPEFPHVEAAEQYAREVVKGKIVACKWVKLACKRHLDDLKQQRKRDFPYRFEPAKAERIIKYLQLLPHTKGKWAAKRSTVKLEPWQKFGIGVPFGWVRKKDGRRRYRTVYFRVPRKNGKSIIAGGIGLYMFTADGEFGAEVYSGATTEKQAWEVFRPAKLMVDRTPELKDAFGVEVNASNMIRLADGSRFEPVIGKPGDGSSPSCAIVDEYHEHPDSSLFDTMETGMGARDQPVMLVITTAGSNIGGPCYQLDRDCQKVLEGTIDNPELWAVIYTIDEGDDWSSEAALIKANPNFDISIDGDFLRARQRDAMQSASKQATFRTKHLNEWVGAKNGWMNMLKWAACPPRKSLTELEGRKCYIGLDLASKVDIAALVAVFPPVAGDPLWHVHGRYYAPEQRVLEQADNNAQLYQSWHLDGVMTLTDGEVIDFETIKEDLRTFATRFDVAQVAYDPFQASQFSQEMTDEGIVMVEVGQTVRNMSEPMKEVEKLVIERTLAHGNCPAMTWMVSNVVAKIDVKDNIYPNKERAEQKIDGPVALIMATGRAMLNEEGPDLSDFLSNPVIV